MSKRASKLELYKRQQEIMKMIGEGYSLSVIKQELSRIYELAPATIEKTYYTMLKDVAKLALQEKEAMKATLLARNESIYQKAYASRNYAIALAANEAIAKLAGLHEKEQSNDKPTEIIVTERLSDKPLKLIGDGNES